MKKKKILFITGTRADYGKLKPLMTGVSSSNEFELYVFVCGMHLLKRFGSTYEEVLKDNHPNTYVAYSLVPSNNAGADFGETVKCLADYIENINPDMIVVHGDRMDALAGATVGALNNTIVAHIEGGELSGTIDESIRHAISKFAHLHFACNEEAKNRLLQLGEEPQRIHVIGSPDIDAMLSENRPTIDMAKNRYGIDFNSYGILMFHPVTTENTSLKRYSKEVVDAVLKSNKNYIVIFPNNDLGSDIILDEYKRLENNSNIRLFPSIRFEYFLTLLEHAEFILGNSSAGIRESGVYGIPGIDIGTRQNGRYSLAQLKNLQHVNYSSSEILNAITKIYSYQYKVSSYGKGDSTKLFINLLKLNDLWNIPLQKNFCDM